MGERRSHSRQGAALRAGRRRRIGLRHQRGRAQFRRQQGHGGIEPGAHGFPGDHRQIVERHGQRRVLGPLVWPAGVGMNGEGDELPPLGQDLQRRPLRTGERHVRPVHQQPLRRAADAQQWRVAQHVASEPFQPVSHVVVEHVDVDADQGAAGQTDGGVRPRRPGLGLDHGGGTVAVACPRRIVAPGAGQEATRLLGARPDRDHRIAVIDQLRAEPGHEVEGDRHQNGTSPARSSTRWRSRPARSRRWSP